MYSPGTCATEAPKGTQQHVLITLLICKIFKKIYIYIMKLSRRKKKTPIKQKYLILLIFLDGCGLTIKNEGH